MAVELSGMARLTNVPDPLSVLGERCKALEARRARDQRLRRAEVFSRSAGAVVLIVGLLVNFGPMVGGVAGPDGEMSSPPQRLGGKAAFAAGHHSPQDLAKAMTQALKKRPMPSHTKSLAPVEIQLDASLPLLAAADELAEVAVPVDPVPPRPAAVLRGLPAGSTVTKGHEVAPGEWAFDLDDFDGVRVSLPQTAKRQVLASIELTPAPGAEPATFDFAIRPGRTVRLARNTEGAVQGRQDAVETGEPLKPAKPRPRASKTLDAPSALGMGRKSRPSDRNAGKPASAPGPAPTFGTIGLF